MIIEFTLFNIFINDVFVFENIAFLGNCAFMFCTRLNQALRKSKFHTSKAFTKISEWSRENFLLLNPNNCHYMCLEKDISKDMPKCYYEELAD